MNYIALGIVAMTIVPIVFGILLGLFRGWRRSLLRFGLIIVSLILAFAFCGMMAKTILNINVQGQTLGEYISEMIKDAAQGVDISNLASALVESIIKIASFLLLFGLLMFLTWAVVFPICNIFVKPYKDSEGKVKKRRLIGAGIGAVQGLIVGFAVCIVLSGLCFQTGRIGEVADKLADLNIGGSSVTASSEPTPSGSNEAAAMSDVLKVFEEYKSTSTGKFYNSLSAPFDMISRVETIGSNKETRKVTLSGTVDALDGIVKLAGKLSDVQQKVKDLDINQKLESGEEIDFKDLKDTFKELDQIKGDLSDEAKETIKDTLSAVSDSLDLPVDLDFSSLDLDELNFEQEGDTLESLFNYSQQKEEIKEEDAKEVVKDVLESQIVMSVLESSDINVDEVLNEEQKDVVEDALDQLEEEGDIDQEKIDALRKLLGL